MAGATENNDINAPAPAPDRENDQKAPRSVLLVCSRNACRSPMAHSLADYHCRGRVYVESVGLHPGDLDGFSIAVMSELGLDITKHRPKGIGEIDPRHFELVISLTPESHQQLMEHLGSDKVEVEYWPTFDPSSAKGNRDQILGTYRHVRDQLNDKIKKRFTF